MAFLHGQLDKSIKKKIKLYSGVKITSGYYKMIDKVYKPLAVKRTPFTQKVVKGEQLDTTKMKNAFMLNVIHSLDGCTVALLFQHIILPVA